MSSLLKDLYSKDFYNRLADALTAVMPDFDKRKFIRMIFVEDFEDKELKERMRHTTEVLHQFLPADYARASPVIEKLVKRLQKEKNISILPCLFLPDYIERYGQEDFTRSVRTMELVTCFITCEFAVRPFILKYGDRMIRQMHTWSLHADHRVRRLASEGMRPRLPWAMAVPALKKDPAPVLRILENLKNDPHEWVRRSVANNLNDISKDHPALVVDVARRWKGISVETDAVIRHGCRTLLKQGYPEMLRYYKLDSRHISLDGFSIRTPRVPAGGDMQFSFSFTNSRKQPQMIRLEYAVYFRRAGGAFSKKVFKISEKEYAPGASVTIQRKQSFKPITTRKYYAGEQRLSVILNGKEYPVGKFELVG